MKYLQKDNLRELPVACLRMPNGVLVEGYANHMVLGRFNGGLFILRHAYSESDQCFVPVLHEGRDEAERVAKVLRQDSEHWTVFPVKTAFGFIADALQLQPA